jgi:hypothetical protein
LAISISLFFLGRSAIAATNHLGMVKIDHGKNSWQEVKIVFRQGGVNLLVLLTNYFPVGSQSFLAARAGIAWQVFKMLWQLVPARRVEPHRAVSKPLGCLRAWRHRKRAALPPPFIVNSAFLNGKLSPAHPSGQEHGRKPGETQDQRARQRGKKISGNILS